MGYILPESFYLRLDPKIRKLVRILHEKWILTKGACEGDLDPKKYPPYPVVFIPLYPPNTDHMDALSWLFQKLGEWNRQGHDWVLRPYCYFPQAYHWLFLEPREKNKRRSPSVLARLQKEAEDLAEFLSRF